MSLAVFWEIGLWFNKSFGCLVSLIVHAGKLPHHGVNLTPLPLAFVYKTREPRSNLNWRKVAGIGQGPFYPFQKPWRVFEISDLAVFGLRSRWGEGGQMHAWPVQQPFVELGLPIPGSLPCYRVYCEKSPYCLPEFLHGSYIEFPHKILPSPLHRCKACSPEYFPGRV